MWQIEEMFAGLWLESPHSAQSLLHFPPIMITWLLSLAKFAHFQWLQLAKRKREVFYACQMVHPNHIRCVCVCVFSAAALVPFFKDIARLCSCAFKLRCLISFPSWFYLNGDAAILLFIHLLIEFIMTCCITAEHWTAWPWLTLTVSVICNLLGVCAAKLLFNMFKYSPEVISH